MINLALYHHSMLLKLDFKSTIIVVLLVALFLVSWIKGCQVNNLKNKLAKCEQADKPKPIHDTTIVLVPEQVPISETITQTHSVKPTKPQVDSFIQYEVVVDTTDLSKLKTAYFDLVREFNTKNSYTDTAIFKNGIAITNSEVYQNKLASQKTKLDSIRQEIIYNTIYKTEKPKDRTQFYFGIEAFGNKNELIQAAGFTGLLKLKSNVGFEGGYYFNSQQQNFYKIGIKFLIRLKKS